MKLDFDDDARERYTRSFDEYCSSHPDAGAAQRRALRRHRHLAIAGKRDFRRSLMPGHRELGLMYFLNLSLFQFLAVFGSISAMSVALYLLDRSRRKQVVSTLRFWVAAEQPAVAARRRRIQQPWSLLLQLLSMALLLLAIAQLRLGSPAQAGRDHVLLVDTSAWMAARSGNRTLMDVARDRARHYLEGAARARPRHAGPRRRHGHAGHRVRSRPPESRGRHSRLAARLDGAQSRPGAVLSRAISRARTDAASAKSPSSARAHRRARSRRHRAAEQSARVAGCRQRGERRPAQGRHAPQRRPTRTSGRSTCSVRNYGTQPHTRDALARFRTTRNRRTRCSRLDSASPSLPAPRRKPRSSTAPAPRACSASPHAA